MRERTGSGGARPLAAVVCCGGLDAGRRVQRVSDRLLDALARGGSNALLVPAMPSAVDAVQVASRCDALVLTGAASHVSPRLYGGPARSGGTEEARDSVAMAVAAAMLSAGRPVLGICRGMQELAVMMGASLRDLEDDGLHMSGHWTDPAVIDHAHLVRLEPAGVLARMCGLGSVRVASVHRQGIDRPFPGMAVEASADDGLVEAFSLPGHAMAVGVQWHPERRRSSLDDALFEGLARAA